MHQYDEGGSDQLQDSAALSLRKNHLRAAWRTAQLWQPGLGVSWDH